MKIVLLIADCPIQLALAAKIHAKTPIHKIFRTGNMIRRKHQNFYYLKRVIRVPFELPFRLAWNGLKERYRTLYGDIVLEGVENTYVENVNDLSVVEYIRKEKPDLIVVSATTMVKKEIIETAANSGSLILNLHTGVSPYIKGGPNCTNWCLAMREYLIGNTVMILNAGIDSGAILATELTPLNGTESLLDLYFKVMEHGFDLYSRIIECYVRDRWLPRSVPQDEITTEGKLFYTRDWTIFRVVQAYTNYRFRFRKEFPKYVANERVKLFPFHCGGKGVKDV